MKMRLILGASVVSLLALFLLMAGCGDGGEEAATTESEVTAEHPSAEHPTAEEAVETATEAAAEAVAMHACAGGCGMDAVPEDKMTEIEGKWYCAGCAKKIQAEGESHGDG